MDWKARVESCKNLGEIMRLVQEVRSDEDARAFLVAYVPIVVRTNNCDEDEALEIVRSNLGYGGHMYDCSDLVWKYFGARDPLIDIIKTLSPQEAFGAGTRP